MFDNIRNIFKKTRKKEMLKSSSKDAAKERLHLVLMQDRANVSADFLDLMKEEIIGVIKKYIDIDESAMDVRLTTETNEEGMQGAPALYANIPIINIKDETRKLSTTNNEKQINNEPPKKEEEIKVEEKQEEIKTKELKEEVKEIETKEIKEKEIKLEEEVKEEEKEIKKVKENKKEEIKTEANVTKEETKEETTQQENEDNVEDKEEKKDEK